MSDSDRERWDKLHADSTDAENPSAFLQLVFRDFGALLKPGKALDIACGTGRNAIFLAQQGWRVDALDISAVALANLQNTARSRGLGITTRVVDLDAAYVPHASYDLVINFNFLQRGLLTTIAQALTPEGFLIFETYLIDQQEIGHPRNPDYLLAHNELLDQWRAMRVLLYREGLFADDGQAAYRAGLFAQNSRSENRRY
jgi:SAM-dependent methyltransferase